MHVVLDAERLDLRGGVAVHVLGLITQRAVLGRSMRNVNGRRHPAVGVDHVLCRDAHRREVLIGDHAAIVAAAHRLNFGLEVMEQIPGETRAERVIPAG